MQQSTIFFDQIRSSIATGNLDDAIKALLQIVNKSSYLNEAILASSRNADLKKDIRNGVVDRQSINVESSLIKQSILDLLDEIESIRSSSLLIREDSDKVIEKFLIENNGGNNANVNSNKFEGAAYIAGVITNNYYGPAIEDAGVKSLACPYCGKEANPDEIQMNGKVHCKNQNCGKQFFELKPIQKGVTKHLNILEENQQEYDDLIFRVNHHILMGQFHEANRLCEDAFAKHPQSPAALEYKALCLYLITSRLDIINNSASQILVCLRQAKDLDPSSTSYDSIAQTIAYKYYGNLIARINKEKDKQNILSRLKTLVEQFETCYKIFPDEFFLVSKILYLSGYEGIAFLRIFRDDQSVSNDSSKDLTFKDKNGCTYLAKDLSDYKNGLINEIESTERRIKQIEGNSNYKTPSLRMLTDEYLMENGINVSSLTEGQPAINPFYLISQDKFIEYRNVRIDLIEEDERKKRAADAKFWKFLFQIGGVILLLSLLYFGYSKYSETALKSSSPSKSNPSSTLKSENTSTNWNLYNDGQDVNLFGVVLDDAEASTLTMREDSSLEGKPIPNGKIPNKSSVFVLAVGRRDNVKGFDSHWLKVKYRGIIGWVWGRRVRID